MCLKQLRIRCSIHTNPGQNLLGIEGYVLAAPTGGAEVEALCQPTPLQLVQMRARGGHNRGVTGSERCSYKRLNRVEQELLTLIELHRML